MSSESFFTGILEYVHTTISTFIFPVSPPGQLISVSPRWNCMSGESSTGMLRIYFQSLLCHLILVSPRWNICLVSPLQKYILLLRIHFQ